MPIITIPKAIYPLVPDAPGVPALLRSAATILDTITLGYLGVSQALSALIGAEPVQWGIFDSQGKQIADYDSIVSVAFQNESRISDYPIEQGAFASYNKVATPFDIAVTLTCGGSEERRSAFFKDISDVRKSFEFYSVLVPEGSYRNVSFIGLTVQRTATNGAHLIIAQLTGREVREKASAAYSSPKNPAAATTQDQGQIQTVDDPNFDASGVV